MIYQIQVKLFSKSRGKITSLPDFIFLLQLRIFSSMWSVVLEEHLLYLLLLMKTQNTLPTVFIFVAIHAVGCFVL